MLRTIDKNQRPSTIAKSNNGNRMDISEYTKIGAFQRKFSMNRDKLLAELTEMYGKDAEKVLYKFEDKILVSNELALKLIENAEKIGVFGAVVEYWETARRK